MSSSTAAWAGWERSGSSASTSVAAGDTGISMARVLATCSPVFQLPRGLDWGTVEKMIRTPPRRRRLVVMGLDNPIHIVFIVVILLLVFGAKRLPEIGRSLGGGMREFKDSVSGNPTQTQQQQTLTPTAQQSQA